MGLYGCIIPPDRASVRGRRPGLISTSAALMTIWGVNPTKDAYQRTPADNRTRI